MRLEETYVAAVEDRIDIDLELGRHRDLIAELERLTSRHPYRERLWEQLMLALYRNGRQAEALRAYRELRRMLGEDLGIEPTPHVTELEGRILLHDQVLLWEPPPPPSNLPTRATSFVGRREEMAEIAKLLDTTRLVTLTGPGGVGKTRLAVEVAEQIRSHFPDGVWWIDLGPQRDPDMVVAALADTLGVTAQPNTPLLETVIRALLRHTALVVVDNCEHLTTSVADLVGAIVGRTKRIRVLATSRVPLHVSGEAQWVVPPLGLPLTAPINPTDVGLSDAVRLFVARGATVDSTFDLTTDNAADVVAVCRRLDAMPLAIEMAAGRVRVLSPSQIAESLSDRFALLAHPEHDTPDRHRTLKTAFDWSYDLLDQDLQHAFDRLSVFAAAFDLDDAAAVAERPGGPPILDVVTGLVDASMVGTIGGDAPVIHYRLLESLREYGAERLRMRGEADDAREAHASHYLELGKQAISAIGTPELASRMARLRSCYPDLRKALDWSLAHHSRPQTLGIAPALYLLWMSAGDGREAGLWGRRMLEGSDAAPAPLQAAAHLAVSMSATLLGEPDQAQLHVTDAVRLSRESDSRPGLITALFAAANVALQVGDLEGARANAAEALEICDVIGDRWGRAGPLAILGFVEYFSGGALDKGRRMAEESQALYRTMGDIVGQVALNPLPAIAVQQGDILSAERAAGDAAAAAVGTAWEGTALISLAEVLLAKQEITGAEAALERGLVCALDGGVEIWFRIALRDLAHVAVRRDDPQRAARLMGASRRNAHHFGTDPAVSELVETHCREALDADTLNRLTDEGYEMSHEALVEFALGR